MARVLTSPHPADLRWSILAAALVAMATWWGLGLPYSLFAWLYDPEQLRIILICYAWEVPVAGALGPMLFGLLSLRGIERRWDHVLRDPSAVDPREAAELERTILDLPVRSAAVLLGTSVVGYAVGALQVRLFAELPTTEVVKVLVLGVATGLIGALLVFLYLERLLTPLAERIGAFGAGSLPNARRVPLHAKVFAGSLILTLNAMLLVGVLFYSRGERILEREIGERTLLEAQHLAREVGATPDEAPEPRSWAERESTMRLGPSGYAALVEEDGTVVVGAASGGGRIGAGFRQSVVDATLAGRAGYGVDRVYRPRIVAHAPVGTTGRSVVAVVERHEFDDELGAMLARGGATVVGVLVLALLQGFLFSRQLTRPIETVTRMASEITHAPGGPWPSVPVRTNDEVGELATAFNGMIARLEAARGELERHSAELERRVAEATRNVAALYEVARSTTSTLEIEDVLDLVAERTRATLGLDFLLVLREAPEQGEAVDVFAASADDRGEHLDVEEPIDLARLASPGRQPDVVSVARLGVLPRALAERVAAERVLRLPLVFKGTLIGVILSGLPEGRVSPDLEFAAALASQAAAALANAGLFGTVRRAGEELRQLSEMRAELQEEMLRTMSRELHDGFGQVLTVINMDLGVLERSQHLEPEALRSRIHEARGQVSSLLQAIRTMSQVLRPPMLDFGLVPTLGWAAEKFTESTQVPVAVRTPPEETRLPSDVELLLYRVAQEALTNVAKHARARHVELELTVGVDEAVLRIADDGVGLPVERRARRTFPGVGLIGMRERVVHHRGRLELSSQPDGGVQIVVTVPIDETEPPAAATG